MSDIKQGSFRDFLLYTSPNGKVKVEIFLRDETVWLTQKRMSDLFGVGIPAVNKHLKNIFESGELQEKSVISILETTAGDGKTYPTKGIREHQAHADVLAIMPEGEGKA